MSIDAMLEHRAVLIAYLRAKIDKEDWHGVSDAANDLRELDAEMRATQTALARLKAIVT